MNIFDNTYLRKLILPLIIEQTLSVTIGMADIIMVSVAGEAAMSGVSLVDIISMLLINLFAAMATGGAVVVAHYLGGKNNKKASEAAGQLILVSLIISIFVMLLMSLFNKEILGLLYGKVETEVMDSAKTYLKISAFSYPFVALYSSGAALFRAMGNSKISMFTALLMNLVHLGFNSLFLYVVRMGAEGVAISTVISRAAACIMILVLLKNTNNVVFIESFLKIKPNLNMIKKIMGIGIPTGIESSFFHLGRIILTSLIATFGIVHTTANGVANTIDYFGCIPSQAIGFAMITVVGQCVGAGDYKQAELYAKKLLKLAYIISGILHVVIIVGLPFMLKIYNLSDDTYRLTMTLVLIHEIFAIVLWPVSFTLSQSLRAAGDVGYTMRVSVISMLFMRIGLGILFGGFLGMGAIGVWIGMVADWILRGGLFMFRFVKGKWKEVRI